MYVFLRQRISITLSVDATLQNFEILRLCACYIAYWPFFFCVLMYVSVGIIISVQLQHC